MVHLGAGLLFWPAFTGSCSMNESLAGIAALLLTLWFLRALEHRMQIHVRFTLRDILQVWRLPGGVMKDVWKLTNLLLHELAGQPASSERYRLLRWTAHATSEEAQGREVLLTTYLSATPNSIVLGVDPGEALVVVHELTPVKASAMAEALGAHP